LKREINQSVKMADEMKSTNIAVGEEAVETSKMEMDTQSGFSKRDADRMASVDPTQAKRRCSETSEFNDSKKCTIL